MRVTRLTKEITSSFKTQWDFIKSGALIRFESQHLFPNIMTTNSSLIPIWILNLNNLNFHGIFFSSIQQLTVSHCQRQIIRQRDENYWPPHKLSPDLGHFWPFRHFSGVFPAFLRRFSGTSSSDFCLAFSLKLLWTQDTTTITFFVEITTKSPEKVLISHRNDLFDLWLLCFVRNFYSIPLKPILHDRSSKKHQPGGFRFFVGPIFAEKKGSSDQSINWSVSQSVRQSVSK